MRAYPDWQGDKCKEKESALKHITSNMVESMLWYRHVWLRLEFTDDVSTFRNRRMNSGVHGAPLSAHIQINAPMMFNSAIWTKWLRFKIFEGRYTESNLQMLCHCLNTWLIYIFFTFFTGWSNQRVDFKMKSHRAQDAQPLSQTFKWIQDSAIFFPHLVKVIEHTLLPSEQCIHAFLTKAVSFIEQRFNPCSMKTVPE